MARKYLEHALGMPFQAHLAEEIRNPVEQVDDPRFERTGPSHDMRIVVDEGPEVKRSIDGAIRMHADVPADVRVEHVNAVARPISTRFICFVIADFTPKLVEMVSLSIAQSCQSASKRDPLSACKRGPPGGVALGLMPGADFALGLA